MRTTLEKIVQHVVTIYRHDNSNKLQNKTKVSYPTLEYTEDVQSEHKELVELLNLQSEMISEAKNSKRVIMTQAVEDGKDPEEPINMAVLENDINEANYKASINPEN